MVRGEVEIPAAGVAGGFVGRLFHHHGVGVGNGCLAAGSGHRLLRVLDAGSVVGGPHSCSGCASGGTVGAEQSRCTAEPAESKPAEGLALGAAGRRPAEGLASVPAEGLALLPAV